MHYMEETRLAGGHKHWRLKGIVSKLAYSHAAGKQVANFTHPESSCAARSIN